MKINNITVETPASMGISYSDIDGNTYRNAKGKMIRDYITTKVKLQCEWNSVPEAEAKKILTNASASPFIEVEYFDPWQNRTLTKTFYVGDRSVDIYSLNRDLPTYKSIKMDFVQR